MSEERRWFPPEMPAPAVTVDTRPFWDACRRHELVVQRCGDCGAFRHIPTPVCWRCRSFAHEWKTVSGRGTLFTFAVVHRAQLPALERYVPFVVALVALDDAPGVRLVSNVVGATPEELRIGMPLEVVFDDVSPEVTVPRFRDPARVTDVDAPAAARLARVRDAMARRGVGALLLATPHRALFATGARRVQVAGSGGSVPWAVVRAEGAPVVFTTDPDGAGACVAEPLAWDRERAFDRLAALVADVRGAVACDVFAPALAARLGRELVDAAPVLADAVAPRTRAELDAIAAALAAARDGVRRACAAAAPGARVAGLVAAFAGAMSAGGAGFPASEGVVRRGGERLPAATALAAGDVLAVEMGLWQRGHAGVAGDTVAVGGAVPEAARRAWSAALCAVAKACRAGATTADVAAAAVRAGASARGPLAHGLGVGVEPPVVELETVDAVSLRAGTVLVLAPVVGDVRATRALVVGDGAPQWLEPAP